MIYKNEETTPFLRCKHCLSIVKLHNGSTSAACNHIKSTTNIGCKNKYNK